MALIELKDVSKKYRRSTTALRHVTVSVNQGEFVYIVGPSGAGKSTFIKLLYREEKLSSGSLKVGEFNLAKLKKRQVPLLRRSIGVVFQDYKLLEQRWDSLIIRISRQEKLWTIHNYQHLQGEKSAEIFPGQIC